MITLTHRNQVYEGANVKRICNVLKGTLNCRAAIFWIEENEFGDMKKTVSCVCKWEWDQVVLSGDMWWSWGMKNGDTCSLGMCYRVGKTLSLSLLVRSPGGSRPVGVTSSQVSSIFTWSNWSQRHADPRIRGELIRRCLTWRGNGWGCAFSGPNETDIAVALAALVLVLASGISLRDSRCCGGSLATFKW